MLYIVPLFRWKTSIGKQVGPRIQQQKELNITINQLNTMKNSRTSTELSSIYLGIWPHYIGNPHTNERGLSAGIDRLSRACSTSLAELSLQLHTTSGMAEIYIWSVASIRQL